MLEHLPRWLGALLHNVRAGHSKLVIVDPELALADATIDLTSTAFANGAAMNARFTDDGDGVSPPLTWGVLPTGTTAAVIVVQDPDAPFVDPIIHALLWGLPADTARLAEGEMNANEHHLRTFGDVGHDGAIVKSWVPPDPPPGHGVHDYVFQIFALDMLPAIGTDPGRTEIVDAMRGHVLAAGMLVGTYARGEAAAAGMTNADAAPILA